MVTDLRKLKHLITVARAGSFSRAAEELHLSQPALSRSVAVVESELGIRIFDRSRNGAELTSLGKLAVAEAELLLRQAQIFDHNLGLYGRGEAGKVSFGIWPLMGSLVLARLGTHFMSRYPKLKMWAAVKSASALLRELQDDAIEMLFCGRDQFEITPDLRVEAIGQVVLTVLVRDGHPLLARPAVHKADLFDYPLLCSVDLSQVPLEFINSGIFLCDNFDVLRETALHSDCYWIAPVQLAHQERANGGLRQVTIVDQRQQPTVEICMVQRQGYELSPAARHIADFVRAFFAEPAR